MRKRTLILGLTGSFSSGKTMVTRMFKRLGAGTIDADQLYKRLLEDKKSGLTQKIALAFGREILQGNEQIDRRKLAEIVFGCRAKLEKLTAITHPEIIKKIKQEIKQAKKEKKGGVLIIDAPLLVEAGLLPLVDKLVVVKTERDAQIARAGKKNGLMPRQVVKIINAQMSPAEKLKLADYVIDNNGPKRETREKVKVIWQTIIQRGQ
ncbi:MAG: dephospho-CoA kinase [Candidatus Omnitrophota bacterium]